MGNSKREKVTLIKEYVLKDLQAIKWKKVVAPKVWRPKPGDELVGIYLGKTTKTGIYGSYEISTIQIPQQGAYTISGNGLIQLLDTALVPTGAPIRIVFEGVKPLKEGREYKLFQLFVEA